MNQGEVREENQSLIVHFYSSFPGLNETGNSTIKNKNGTVALVETVRRLGSTIVPNMYQTPLYGYELLNQAFDCKCNLKLETMQRFASSWTRSVLGIIHSNFFNQQDQLGFKDLKEVSGIVLVMGTQFHLFTWMQ